MIQQTFKQHINDWNVNFLNIPKQQVDIFDDNLQPPVIDENYYFSNKIPDFFINNSLLSLVRTHPLFVKKMINKEDIDKEDKNYFIMGSAVDTLLTGSQKEFDSKFKILSANKPTGLMLAFIEALPIGITKQSSIDDYVTAYNKANYKMSIDKVVESFWSKDDYYDYYWSLHTNIYDQRKPLYADDYAGVMNAVENLKESRFASYFNKRIVADGIENLYQVPLFFNFMTINGKLHKCKALLDMIQVNHKEKTIQLIDLKTKGFDIYNFKKSFYEYGYYRQAAMYQFAIGWIKADSFFADYSLLPFKFIVTPKDSKYSAVMAYNVHPDTLDHGMFGETIKDVYYPGIDDLINDLKWHIDNNYWSAPAYLAKKNFESWL